MKEKLDNKTIELTKIIFDLKQSLDLHKLLVLNAIKINKKAGKTFFAYVQRIALKSFVIDICKVFEEKKKNQLNSIPQIISYIHGNGIEPKNQKIIEDYINKYEVVKSQEQDYGTLLKKIFHLFIEKNKGHLYRFKKYRDIKIAHTEDTKEQIDSLPSYDIMEGLLNFAIDFYSMVHMAYIGGYPVEHMKEKRVFTGLCSILKELGHESIKTDFDD